MDIAHSQVVAGGHRRQPVDGCFGFRDVTGLCAVEQCFHQEAGRRNAPPQQLRLTREAVDHSTQLPDRLVPISALSPNSCHGSIDDWLIPEIMCVAGKFVAHSHQVGRCVSTLGGGCPVHEGNAQRQPGERDRRVVAGLLGDS